MVRRVEHALSTMSMRCALIGSRQAEFGEQIVPTFVGEDFAPQALKGRLMRFAGAYTALLYDSVGWSLCLVVTDDNNV
jgi:hypothetical protein